MVFDDGVDRGGQVAAGQAGKVIGGHAAKDVHVQLRLDLAALAYGAQTFNLVADVADRVLDVHVFDYLVADSTKVDNIAARFGISVPVRLLSGCSRYDETREGMQSLPHRHRL